MVILPVKELTVISLGNNSFLYSPENPLCTFLMRRLYPLHLSEVWPAIGEVFGLVVTERDLHAAELALEHRVAPGVGAWVGLAGGPGLLHAGRVVVQRLRLAVTEGWALAAIHTVLTSARHRVAPVSAVGQLIHVWHTVVHHYSLVRHSTSNACLVIAPQTNWEHQALRVVNVSAKNIKRHKQTTAMSLPTIRALRCISKKLSSGETEGVKGSRRTLGLIYQGAPAPPAPRPGKLDGRFVTTRSSNLSRDKSWKCGRQGWCSSTSHLHRNRTATANPGSTFLPRPRRPMLLFNIAIRCYKWIRQFYYQYWYLYLTKSWLRS